MQRGWENTKDLKSAYVTATFQACAMKRKHSRAKPGDQNGCFLNYQVLSIFVVQYGRSKILNKDSVDANLFTGFHETKNGGFGKRIRVDRA